MAERTVILSLDEGENYTVKTSFSSEDLQEVADNFTEAYDEDSTWTNQDVLDYLVKLNYITVIGPAPEIVELMLI